MPQLMVTKKLNKRSQIPDALPDASHIVDTVQKGYIFFGTEVAESPGTKLPSPPLNKWYKDSQGFFYWAGALMIVDDSPVAPTASSSSQLKQPLLAPPASMPLAMPLSYKSCVKCTHWMKVNFEAKIINATNDTPFDKELVYAIACQETAQRWSLWIDTVDAATLLQRCVFDASGDAPGTSRSAFPKNKTEMIARHGQQITQMLVDEANKMRALPQPGAPNGYHSSTLLYKGYGIFQYDLQHFETDAAFFTQKLWYSIDECIARLLKELNTKYVEQHHNILATVRSYNGSGPRAEQYAKNVSQFYAWIRAMQ